MKHRKSLKWTVSNRLAMWSALSAVLTLIFAVVVVITFSIRDAEDRAATVAKSTAKAFRPMILSGRERDAYFQIVESLNLKSTESVRIVKANGEQLYPQYGPANSAQVNQTFGSCRFAETSCSRWIDGYAVASFPIFFDAGEKSRYAAIEVALQPTVGWSQVLILFIAILTPFLMLFIGFKHSLISTYDEITREFSIWSDRLRNNPKSTDVLSPPFVELEGLATDLGNLKDQIAALESEAETTAKMRLIREVAHDMQTPLSQLAKYVEIIMIKRERGLELKDEDFRQIKAAMRRSDNLIKQVRESSAGAEDGSTSANVHQTIEEYVSQLNNDPIVVEKGIKLEPIALPEVLVDVPMSSINLHRVVDNVVRNAIDFSPNHGRVGISTTLIGKDVVISVSDEGPGIPDAIASRIFQADFSTKPSRGTGLGLWIVQSICQRFGGTVSFENLMPQGTKFHLSIPVRATGGKA